MNRHSITLFLLVILSGSYTLSAQNLVTNPGFERKNHCPRARGQISYTPFYDYFETVLDWVSPLNTSPDYFSRCGTDSSVRVPNLSFDGYHQPHSGDAFAGISMYTGFPHNVTRDSWCEYLETRLAAPLVEGHDYYLSFYVCLAYHSPAGYNIISIDKIGARFTSAMEDTDCKGPMFYLRGPADVETPAGFFITDTASWTLVSGVYHARGGEQWLTIGSFYVEHVNARLLYSPVNSLDSIHCTCAMMVDDVCVTDMAHPVVTDTTIYTPQFPVSIGAGKPAGQYKWNTGDTALEIEIQAPGTFERQRWSDCGYYIDRFKVEEMAVQACVWLPTAFTPNNDGENDLFGPGNNNCSSDLKNFSFIIFNRWGQTVFETKTPGEKWDGKLNGIPQEIGVYPYILRYSFTGPLAPPGNPPSETKMVKGNVTLIR